MIHDTIMISRVRYDTVSWYFNRLSLHYYILNCPIILTAKVKSLISLHGRIAHLDLHCQNMLKEIFDLTWLIPGSLGENQPYPIYKQWKLR